MIHNNTMASAKPSRTLNTPAHHSMPIDMNQEGNILTSKMVFKLSF